MTDGGTATPQRTKSNAWPHTVKRSLDFLILGTGLFLVYVATKGLGPVVHAIFAAVTMSWMIGASTLLHEMGHAAAAWISGWRVLVITVWPVALHVPTLRFVFNRRVSKTDGGGYVAVAPGSMRSATPLRKIAISLGGPIVSLCATLFCFALAAAPRPEHPRIFYDMGFIAETLDTNAGAGHRIALLISAFGWVNLGSFMRTIIPAIYANGHYSDGLSVLRILQGKQQVPGPWSVWVATMLYYNLRLREIPVWMYDAARANDAGLQEDVAFHDGLDVARALDAKKVSPEHVRSLIAAYRAHHGDNDWLLTCDAFLAAIFEADTTRAKDALSALKEPSGPAAMIPAAEAALAARMGDKRLMARKLDQMDAACARERPFPNATFRDIRRTIERVAATTPPASA